MHLKVEDKNLFNFLSIFSSVLSVYGLVLTYLQVKSATTIAEETKKTVENSLSRINQLHSISDLATTVKVIEEINGYIKGKDFSSAHLRMLDIRPFLVSLPNDPNIKEFLNKVKYKAIFDTFVSDLNIISSYHGGHKTLFRFPIALILAKRY